METGSVQVYYGEGRGKTPAAFGLAMRKASQGKSVFIIQFLKGRTDDEMEFLKRMEPEVKFFRFEKSEEHYNDLSEQEQKDEACNIKNGLNFARKVLCTGECSLLILDEVLGLVDNGVVEVEDLIQLIQTKSEDTQLILTGWKLPEQLKPFLDEIYNIVKEK